MVLSYQEVQPPFTLASSLQPIYVTTSLTSTCGSSAHNIGLEFAGFSHTMTLSDLQLAPPVVPQPQPTAAGQVPTSVLINGVYYYIPATIFSGQTAGYAVEAATGNTATGPFPMDDSVTTASTITAHKTFAAPSIKTTGTGCPICTGTTSNYDLAGQLTLSGGTASYSFVASPGYVSAPICTASDTTAANAVQVTVTTSTLTLTGTGTDVIDYICIGRT